MSATLADYKKYINECSDDAYTIIKKPVVIMFYGYLTKNSAGTRSKLSQARCCAALLSGLINLVSKFSEYEWVYKSELALAEYSLLTHEEIIGTKKILRNMGILLTDRSGRKHTNRYKINFDVLLSLLMESKDINIWERDNPAEPCSEESEEQNPAEPCSNEQYNPAEPCSNDQDNTAQPGLNNNIYKEIQSNNNYKAKNNTPALRNQNTNFSNKQNPKEQAVEKAAEARQTGDWSQMTDDDFAYYYASQHEAILGKVLVNSKGNPILLFRGEFITRLCIPIDKVCDVIDAVLVQHKGDITVDIKWRNLLTYNALFTGVVDDRVRKIIAKLCPVISKYANTTRTLNSEDKVTFTPEEEAELLAMGVKKQISENGEVTYIY
jgi:hypothetical protein